MATYLKNKNYYGKSTWESVVEGGREAGKVVSNSSLFHISNDFIADYAEYKNMTDPKCIFLPKRALSRIKNEAVQHVFSNGPFRFTANVVGESMIRCWNSYQEGGTLDLRKNIYGATLDGVSGSIKSWVLDTIEFEGGIEKDKYPFAFCHNPHGHAPIHKIKTD
jgi:hypothetical protein